MSADTAAVLLVLAAAPAVTIYPIWYGLTLPWWKTAIGRALMVSSTALAELVDISLLYQWLGDDYYFRDVVRLTVYTQITCGAWMLLGAFASQRWHTRQERRQP